MIVLTSRGARQRSPQATPYPDEGEARTGAFLDSVLNDMLEPPLYRDRKGP
jgi:hypothetical protein